MPNWGYGPKEIVLTAGQHNIVQLNVPHRGRIESIDLRQLGGTDAIPFEIFTSEAAAKSLLDPEDEDYMPEGSPRGMFSLTGELTTTAGIFSEKQLELPYINRDGTPSNGVRRLWMRVTPAGSGEVTMHLAMMISPE